MGSERKGGWDFTDHACRQCMGRVMTREDPDGGPAEHRCAECGQTALGEAHALCWCGVEVKGHDHPFECFANDNPTVSTPQQILVRERKSG
ncbi:MAG: hypothetical protein ACJ75S_07240 [Solirubrobacterales bacterium]|jgi:hypothetical protein